MEKKKSICYECCLYERGECSNVGTIFNKNDCEDFRAKYVTTKTEYWPDRGSIEAIAHNGKRYDK